MRVEIIGAGVAGLSLGIRLRRRGVETVIYERQERPGGLCTAWRRDGYTFDGCLHWLLGAREGTPFHTMWGEVADLGALRFVDFEERVDIEVPDSGGGTWHFHLYNDVDRLEEYLLRLSPDDAKTIAKWMDAIRTVARLLPLLPPRRAGGAPASLLREAPRLAPLWRLLPLMRHWSRQTTKTFAGEFRNPALRRAVERLYMDEVGMTTVIFGQAYMSARVAAYPLGGSAALTRLLVDTYRGLGGELRTSTGVESIVVAGGRATGLVLSDGTTTHADAICSCADWRWTVGQALGRRYAAKSQLALLDAPKEAIFRSYCRVHIGYGGRLDSLPHFLRLMADYTLPDGTHFEQLEVEVNNFDTSMSPPGKTTLTVNYSTSEGGWWIDMRNTAPDEYGKAKKEVERATVDALCRAMRGKFDRGKIEVVDVVTPATFHRYTGNALGSSQGWAPMRNQLRRLPTGPTLPGLSGFVMAGHWLEAGGGVPIALLTALRAEKILFRTS